MLSMAARLSRQSTRRNIRNNLGRFLGKSGFRIWGVESAEDFYVALLRERADLVLVDLGLPGEDGLSLVKRLAGQGIAVVVLTARGDLSSRITGLESEALQYFVKPTDLNELVAGIRSLLRRPGQAPAALAAMGSWRLRTAEAVLVSPDNKPVALTTRELELMCCLARTRRWGAVMPMRLSIGWRRSSTACGGKPCSRPVCLCPCVRSLDVAWFLFHEP